ncbi:MAG: DUF4366 domain-containing protein [Lachnospiraceae bacterium]|nr:DUF4366 domain-containing protein [Lachnospiraceae bacterium]
MLDSEAFAGSGEEYITITVDAEDDNEGLMYSIDSTDEAAFTSSNTFTIPAGTSHTIYVKDAAGNVTSQDYSPSYLSPLELDENVQDINIDVEIGNKDYSSILDPASSPAEPGEGTMHDRTVTDGSDDGEKVFYTVTTAEGDTFYMVIDKKQNTENVYLLNTVTRSDLAALATDDDGTEQKDGKEEDNLLTALQNEKEADSVPDKINSSSKEKSGMSSNIIIVVFVLIIAGGYYYIKIYKNKKEQQMDVMDAMDMNDFAAEEAEDEGDEVDFDIADDEKQAYLDNLINDGDDEESDLYDQDPENYTAESYTDLNEEESVGIDNDESHVDPDNDDNPTIDEEFTEYDPDLDAEEDE